MTKNRVASPKKKSPPAAVAVAVHPAAHAAPAATTALAPMPAKCFWSAGWMIATVAVLMLAAFASSFTKVWDSDIFWHLASGHWMLEHGKVLGTDPFSIDPKPEWVNVHWLFQLTIAALHQVGGFELLSVFKGVMAALTLGTFAFWLRKKVPPAWLILCGLGMLLTIASRIRVRPEAFTLLFLTITVLLVDSVRQGAGPRRMWWIVLMTVVWVNMHGIYILGLAVVWSAIACAAFERYVLRNTTLQGNLLTQHALSAAVVASAACLVTPWPLEAAIQPLLLWTRVSGNNDFYTYAVSELFPTWKALGNYYIPLAFAACTAAIMLVNFIMGLVGGKARLPLAHVGWFLAFVFLAALAKRNVALVGPVCGFLLAWHGKDILLDGRIAGLMRSKLWAAVTVLLIVVAVLQTASYATEMAFRRDHSPFRFGAGLNKEEFPVDLAMWLSALPAEGDVLVDDFGDASAFIYYGSVGREKPVRLLYMDGRLEAHDESRFIEQHRIHTELQKAQSARLVQLPPTVRFIIVRHDAPGPLGAMAQSPERYRLLKVDDTCACFEDKTWASRNSAGSILPGGAFNIADLDQPLVDNTYVKGTPLRPRYWWSDNPLSLNYRRGEMLLYLGQYNESDIRGQSPAGRYKATLLACRYLGAAKKEGSAFEGIDTGMLAQAFQNRAYQNYYSPGPQIPINMDLARALHLYGQMDLDKLTDESTRRFAQQHLRTLLLAGQTDSAAEAVARFMSDLPPGERVNPRAEYFDLRNAIGMQLAKARSMADQVEAKSPLEVARILTDPKIGLIDQALENAIAYKPGNAAAAGSREDLLFELFLRKGKTGMARALCMPGCLAAPQTRALRLALCDWVDGEYERAAAALSELASGDKSPLVHFYLADLMELTGNYEAGRQALYGVSADDAVMAGVIDRLRQRLDDFK